MRLTLRTMLAYMDDILEPDDATDIGKKLEESDLAKGIMHRLRDSIRRLRLGAPPPLGHGMGLDPNSVAEYLDNTLPAEQVGEFEKICLESDVHLAEVGACHQILTLVLGEPAEVDAAARERMYHIAAKTAVPQAAPAQFVVPVAAPVTAAIQPARRTKPEVPDYLREPRSRNWAAMVVVLVLVVVSSGVATVVFLPEVRKMVGRGVAEVAGEEAPPVESVVADVRPSAGDNPAPATDLSSGNTSPESPAAESPVAPEVPSEEMSGGDLDASAGKNPLPDNAPEPESKIVVPVPMPEPAQPPVAVVGAAPPDETPPGEVLGRYIYKQDVLLRMDRGGSDRAWRRLPAAPSPSLAAGDRLMALTAFRPTITLITGVTIQPVDASLFELLGVNEAGVPGISVEYGRLVLFTDGKPHNSIRIQMGDRQALLTFVDGESTMAIDVRRPWIAGKDPALAPGPLVADLFVTSGAVIWDEAGARSEWKAPQHAIADTQGVRLVDAEIAKWTRAEALSRLELGAAETVEHELTGDQPVSLSVKELLGYRKVEVRALAIRVAANVDEFEPLVKMLNDPEQKLLWHVEIEALRAAMTRDPETAKLVQKACESRRGADGAEIYRMLRGYSAEDVSEGAMNKLVEYLNNDEWLDLRVLAFQNLRDITGKPLSYKPEASSAVRRPAYLKWKERIKELKPVPGSK